MGIAATVLVGYPGTIADMAAAGRGRGRDESLTVLLGYSNPLDQYFMRHPQELFSRSPEHALPSRNASCADTCSVQRTGAA